LIVARTALAAIANSSGRCTIDNCAANVTNPTRKRVGYSVCEEGDASKAVKYRSWSERWNRVWKVIPYEEESIFVGGCQ
jgi:hypothetical protein